MYKRIKGKKFSRKTDQRKAFIRGLAAGLIMKEKITTTKTRARAASTFVEKMITKAKRGGLSATRQLMATLPVDAAKKLTSNLAQRFSTRNGGYTRIIRLGQRVLDGAEMAVVEFIDYDVAAKEAEDAKKEEKKGKKKEGKKKAKKEDNIAEKK